MSHFFQSLLGIKRRNPLRKLRTTRTPKENSTKASNPRTPATRKFSSLHLPQHTQSQGLLNSRNPRTLPRIPRQEGKEEKKPQEQAWEGQARKCGL